MSLPANLRGWGPGWPTNRSADMTMVRAAARSGVTLEVHKGVAPIIQFLVDETERRGYLFSHPGDTPDDWGYANRNIAGTRVASNHSWGLAVDLDATEYPQHTNRRLPQWIVDLWKAYGFEYGGDWSPASRDPMHMEFAGSITEARFLVAALAASHIQGVPAPVPPDTPPAPTEDPMQVVHCPDGPGLSPDAWFITDGDMARVLAGGEAEWYLVAGLIPRPQYDTNGKIKPVPMPWAFFSKLRRV